MRVKTKAYIAWFAVSIIWGTTYLVIRVGVSEMPPFLFAGLRWLTAAPIFILFLKWKGVKFPPKREIYKIAIIGILLIGLGNGLITFGEQWIPSGLTALLITTMPVLIVLIETFILKKVKFNKIIVLGSIVALGGVFIIFGSNLSLIFEYKYLFGIIAIYVGIVAWAIGTVYSKYNKINSHPFSNAAIQMLIGGLFQITVGLILGEAEEITFTQNGIYSFIYLAVFGSFIAYASFIYAIEHLPISFVATYAFINPVIALFVGWIILDENLTPGIIFAAVVIIGGVATINYGNKKNSNF